MNIAPYATLYLIPAFISSMLVVLGWRRRQYRAARQFSLLMLALAIWSACHAFSVADSTFAGTLFWAKVQYAGIALVGPFWLLFALAYAEQWRHVTLRLQAVVFCIALGTCVVVLTNDHHRLWWTQVTIDTSRPFVSLRVERGFLFWLHTTYTYGCMLSGLGLFMHTMIVSPRIYQRQALLMVIGALLPLGGNLAHLLGLRMTIVDDPTPFLLLGSGLLSFYALMRYQLLDLAPIAKHEIFAGIPDGVVILDRYGLVTEVNQPAPSLLSVDSHPWMGMRFLDLVTASPLASALHEMFQQDDLHAARLVTYTAQDELRAVEIRLHPLLTDSGMRSGSFLLLRDMTEQVRVERELERRFVELTALNRITRVANAAVQREDLIRFIARESVSMLHWKRVAIGLLQSDNTTLHMVIDYPIDESQSLEQKGGTDTTIASILAIIHTGRTTILDREMLNTLSASSPCIMQYRDLQSVIVAPLYSQSRPIGALFVGNIAQTVTKDHIRLVETVGELCTEAIVRTRLYEEARQANYMKSVFFSMVSHELRTYLTSITGYTNMLQRGIYGQLPESFQAPLDCVEHSSQTLLRLITDILDFSRMESGQFMVELFPVELDAVIRNVTNALRPQIVERGLELFVEMEPNLPLAHANSSRVEQVLTNLLSNAIKYTESGNIRICVMKHADRICISVVDTGIGIEPKHQEMIFQEFQQITNAQTQHFKGTGLGLAICRRLMELMGGTIRVESTLGVGSRFYIELQAVPTDMLVFQRKVGDASHQDPMRNTS